MKNPLHILLVEDSADDVDLIRLAIKRAGATVKLDVKMDGQEAMEHLMGLKAFPAQSPNLILLDLNMPKKNGREVLAEIKQTDHLRTIPVIVFTTSRAEPDIVISYRLGAACYVVKPDEFDKLVRTFQHFCAFWECVQFSPKE